LCVFVCVHVSFLCLQLVNQDAESQRLAEETAADAERQLAELERKRQRDEELAAANSPTIWDCPICTYRQAAVVVGCAMCGTPNPNPARPKGKKAVQSAPAKKEAALEEKALPLAEPVPLNRLLFHQLRARCAKVLSLLLDHGPTLELLLRAGLLPSLLTIAVCPTRLSQFESVERLEATQATNCHPFTPTSAEHAIAIRHPAHRKHPNSPNILPYQHFSPKYSPIIS
jgi:hypothetical protein